MQTKVFSHIFFAKQYRRHWINAKIITYVPGAVTVQWSAPGCKPDL